MTSQINYGAIATNYPVAGEDNDSQGFRDNFTAISAGLALAKSEITALQNNSVLVADLATSSNRVQNNMLGSTIYNALYNQFYGVFFNGGSVSSTANIDLANGPIQQFTLTGDPTLTFTNWPDTGKYAVIRVILVSDGNGVRKPIFANGGGNAPRYDVDYPKISNLPGFKVGGESLASVTVTVAGDGYISVPEVTISGPTQTGGTTPVGQPTFKAISATVTSGGTGWAVGNTLVINENPNVVLTVTAISGGGATGPMTNASVVPSETALALPLVGSKTVTALQGTGAGASVTVSCGIKGITITDAGDGYHNNAHPTITIEAGTGVQAEATSDVTSNTFDNPKVIEAWTVDGGTNVYIRFVAEYN